MQYCPISLLFSLPAVASDSTLTRMAEIATVLGTIVGLIGIYLAWSAFKAQRESLDKQIEDSKTADENTKIALAQQDTMIDGITKMTTQQAILGAWSLLAQKGTGDLGRKDALEFLHSKGKSLAGLDLTGAYLFVLRLKGDLGGQVPGQAFIQLNLESAIFNHADLSWANFEGAYLSFAKFNRASLYHTTFNGANLTGADFTNALLIQYAEFSDCYVAIGDYPMEKYLPTAPEGWKFELEIKKDGNPRFEAFNLGTPVEQIRTYIKLIKTETKNP